MRGDGRRGGEGDGEGAREACSLEFRGRRDAPSCALPVKLLSDSVRWGEKSEEGRCKTLEVERRERERGRMGSR